MILCVAPVAYRRATGALESPKGQLLWSVKLSVGFSAPIGVRSCAPNGSEAGTREVFSGSN